jgi:hypothetical protein
MMTGFPDRVLRAVKLDVHLFEEVQADPRAMGQAVAVVVLSSMAAGIGTWRIGGINAVLGNAFTSLLGWYIWAYLTYFIGTRLLPEPQTNAEPGELLRTLGFASAPGIIRVVAIVPGLAESTFLVAALWMLTAMVIAVRQSLDYESTWRAVGVCVVGWVMQLIIFMVVVVIS